MEEKDVEMLMRAAAFGLAAMAAVWFVAIAVNFCKTVVAEDKTFRPRRNRAALLWYLEFGAIRLAGLLLTGTAAAYGILFGLGG